jgi:uncharacterized BrkB/YihY/UPF0761 family membrane protein
MLAAAGLFHAVGGDTNVFADRLIEHHHLTGATARLVRETFGTAAHNALAASVVAVIGFLTWGIGIGQIYQDTYARAWHIRVRTVSDQARFTIWFFVLSGLLGLFIVFVASLKQSGWAIGIPSWLGVLTAFWLWTPRYPLDRKIGLRPCCRGALFASLLLGGATAVSPFFLAPSLNSDGTDFGSLGVVIALLAWSLILTTISMACAVLFRVRADWREHGRHAADGWARADRYGRLS